MWLDVLYILLTVVLIVLFFQDIKHRAIDYILPILIFCIGLIINHFYFHKEFNWIYSLGFILVNMVAVTLYFSFKSKQLVNPLKDLIGVGDIVFFIAITPFFLFKEYILFFTLSLIFSLLIFFCVKQFKRINTIPLAGYMSLFFIGNIIAERFFNTSLL